jgi:hypothetical protein
MTAKTKTGAGKVTATQLQDLQRHFAKFFPAPPKKNKKAK